ncbi:Glycosyltransferase sdnJ [Lachnellula occidentalis]|uniref:Glycosyltransferase sdnJ n=1 Tax=Lachnellula occidentalis TaxID=215460 RepID=A0A8H8UFL1_9HELO|nr:Glycosyltransferase sdnJ [Lachnellula occidentalis]
MASNEKSTGSSSEERGHKKILFLTSSEYGQANVILAVAYELLLRRKYQVHFASFAPLEGRIRELNALAATDDSIAAVFHSVPGPSSSEALAVKDDFIGPYPPGVQGALDTYRVTLPEIANTWNEREYMLGYESCRHILQAVHPDIIVADPLFSQGLDACLKLSRKYVVLSPNTFQDILRKRQPLSRLQFFLYPAISSAFPYPVPWHLIPANIFLKTRLIGTLVTSPTVRSLMSWRKAQNLPALPPAFKTWQKENHYLVPSIPETDFPCHLESNVTACGPILLPSSSVSEIDPELQAWLMRGPTVLINLGSHIRMDGSMARQFASTLRHLLDKRPDVQVLWKLKISGAPAFQNGTNSKSNLDGGLGGTDFEGPLDEISYELATGRVKVLEWLSVDPLAVLQTGRVVCSVHHGGSNSFHEALSAGVPQIVLPCWLDTFEFANRVEYLGIGIYGSRSAAPRIEAGELSRALSRVLGDGKEASSMRYKAKELAEISGRVGGRVKACEKIIELLERI